MSLYFVEENEITAIALKELVNEHDTVDITKVQTVTGTLNELIELYLKNYMIGAGHQNFKVSEISEEEDIKVLYAFTMGKVEPS